MTHFVTYCKPCKDRGVVKIIAQCRCPGPDKAIRLGVCGICAQEARPRMPLQPILPDDDVTDTESLSVTPPEPPGLTILDMTMPELRSYAESVRDAHTPKLQDDNPYDRCGQCQYTRHPCDTFEMADALIQFINLTEVKT